MCVLYGLIRSVPHQGMKICWLEESKQQRQWVFGVANRQIGVHLGAPGVMGVYYIMIIIKTLKTDWILFFLRCQIILWWQSAEPHWRAWFGCCLHGHTPSYDYGIPTCDFNDATRSVAGLFHAATHWATDTKHTQQNGENTSCLDIAWSQVY